MGMGWFLDLVVLVYVSAATTSVVGVPDVCGIASFFNPGNSQLRIDNYHMFRKRTREQGLKMVISELAFGTQPFVVQAEDEWTVAIHRRTSNPNAVLWQKEALLNLAMKNIPQTWTWCTKIVWLDTDVLLEDGWMAKISDMLENGNVIGQAFSHLVQLPKYFMGNPEIHWMRARQGRLPIGTKPLHVRPSAHAKGSMEGGYPGFAWGATRVLLEEIGGFYDRAIVGGFDALLFNLVVGENSYLSTCEARFNEDMYLDFYARWGTITGIKVAEGRRMIDMEMIRNANVYAAHLWHGERDRRGYQSRHDILLNAKFNPKTDVEMNDDGILVWNGSDAVLKQIHLLFEEREGGEVTCV